MTEKMKLLLIDDEPRLVDNIIFELEIMDVKVEFSSDVDSAMKEHFGDLTLFDGVICDVQMPHRDSFTTDQTNGSRTTGLALLKEIRRRSQTIRVALLTNVDETFEAGAAIVSSAVEYAPCRIVKKRDKLSYDIAKEVKDFFDEPR
jgi:DNA-binding NtrC family response regulator